MSSAAAPEDPWHVDIGRDSGTRWRLEVEGYAASGERRSRCYRVAGQTHSDYAALFSALAADFGCRPPLAGSPGGSRAAPSALRPLLTEAVAPDILYGYGDPAVLRLEEDGRGPAYYLVATSNDAPQSCPIITSRDLVSWDLAGYGLPEGGKPIWAARDGEGAEYWAPELHKVGDEYLLCFAARLRNGEFGIGFATADSPAGPFVPEPAPLLDGGVIDPHVYTDGSGLIMLYWKQDSNDVWPIRLAALLRKYPGLASALFSSEEDIRTAGLAGALSGALGAFGPMERFLMLQTFIEAVIGSFAAIRRMLEKLGRDDPHSAEIAAVLEAMTTRIYGQPLAGPPWRLVGDPVVVLENDLEWEGHLVEGPWVWSKDGRYYIFYSGNDFSTARYGVGVGVGPSPLGPFSKQPRPLLQSTEQWWGLGHPSAALAPDGRVHLFVHGYPKGKIGYKEFRALLDVPVILDETGARLAD